jgi:heme A synthase
MTGGVEYEHTHRVVATLVGLLTIGLWVWLLRANVSRRLKMFGLIALIAVIVQGVLGGVTVLLKLPTWISTTHLGLSMLFFMFLLFISAEISGKFRWSSARFSSFPARSALVLTFGVYLQILLGGLVRHTGAGRVCGVSFPWCFGAAWPEAAAMQTHMLHRYFGIVLGVALIVWGLYWFIRMNRAPEVWRWIAIGVPVLTLVQVILGIVTITTNIGIVEVTAHLGIGALLLLNLFALTLYFGGQASVDGTYELDRRLAVTNS